MQDFVSALLGHTVAPVVDPEDVPGQSPLRALDRATLSKVVAFLDKHVKSLLQLMAELEGTGRPWPELVRYVRSTRGQYQTPACVIKPKILPAPDLAIAKKHLDLLRGQRKTLHDYIRIATLRGGPDYLERRLDERLLDAISALREALEDIHGVRRIIFVGEDSAPPAGVVTNTIGDGARITGNVVLAGSTGDITFGGQDSFDPRTDDPLVVRAEVLPGLCHADVVVDGDPPEAVTPSGSIFVIYIQSRMPGVVIKRSRAKVLDRRPPRRACLNKRITGIMTPRRFDLDFDSATPELVAQGVPSSFKVSPDDPEEFWVQAVTSVNEVTWQIELDWIAPGVDGPNPVCGTTAVKNYGTPFSLYPIGVLAGPDGTPSALRTACDLTGHEDECPTLKLKSRFPNASISTYTPVRDLENECWFDGMGFQRELGG